MDPNQYQNDRDERRLHAACGLTVNGQLGLQPFSFHVETLFPAQVNVQRQAIPAAAIFFQRHRRGIFVETRPKYSSSVRSGIFRYAAPMGLWIFIVSGSIKIPLLTELKQFIWGFLQIYRAYGAKICFPRKYPATWNLKPET
jgi:hypothetical protein